MQQLGKGVGGGLAAGDSLKRRDKFEDSITVRFRYLDSTRNYLLDSSVDDFTRRFPIPATNIFLGNTGTASRSILFSPILQAGWDPGLHAFDIYKWKLEKVRFFSTTRPYSELNYMLATRAEQYIELLHTQNITPNWNFMLQYRLINAPGFFKNQKTNHNNYLFTSWFQTVNKRYNAYLVLLANKLQAGENGGIQDTADFINDPVYGERFNIPTKIGGDPAFGTDFFNTDIGTGNRYKDFTAMLRQQYDFGKKDSLVTDSTIIPLFYPRLRLEYNVQYSKSTYNFRDEVADSLYYANTYGIQSLTPPRDTFQLQDQWREIINDFSIYTFPDAKNLQQFLKLGAAVQNISLDNIKGSRHFYNAFGHAEYRNRTRNQKWDIEAVGKLYFTGLNAGNYQVLGKLQRSVGKRGGYVQLGFENVNRTPSFVYDSLSEFYLQQGVDFKKENTTHLSAVLFQPGLQLQLSGHYYLMTNYTYFTDFYKAQQENTLFNMLQIGLQKTIRIGRFWRWHADIYFQQLVGDAPVNVPQIFTRNRIGYEGKLGFKNLNIAFGAEVRYHTPYKADSYSPALGQFFYQDSIRLNNPMPDITLYLHFRIQSFKFYLRGENLNTARTNDGFGFTNNNFAAPGYPYPGLVIRLGVYWSFVN